MNGDPEHQEGFDQEHGHVASTSCDQVSHLSRSSHPSTPPVRVYRDAGDTWDTIKRGIIVTRARKGSLCSMPTVFSLCIVLTPHQRSGNGNSPGFTTL